jgi:hypothetical protein
MTTKNDKKAIMIYASNKDADRFKQLQKEFKQKGYNSSALFREMLEAYDKGKGGF